MNKEELVISSSGTSASWNFLDLFMYFGIRGLTRPAQSVTAFNIPGEDSFACECLPSLNAHHLLFEGKKRTWIIKSGPPMSQGTVWCIDTGPMEPACSIHCQYWFLSVVQEGKGPREQRA